MAKLTEKQKRFIDEYLMDLNATTAYKAAYPNVINDEVAASAAVRLLRNVKVQKYLSERQTDFQRRTEITLDKVILELAKVAFANGSDFTKAVPCHARNFILIRKQKFIRNALLMHNMLN